MRQLTQVERQPPPDGADPGCVAERHKGFNWVTCQWAWAWDTVDTPS